MNGVLCISENGIVGDDARIVPKKDKMGFFEDVYEVVKRIPKGKVTSYGRVAAAVGRPRAARVVGYALHGNPDPDNIPCHRVVFKDGALSKAFAFGGENAQKAILESEGVVIEDGKVKAEYFIR